MDVLPRSPRSHAGTPRHNSRATERSRELCAEHLLSRSNELLHVSRTFSAWAAATRQRKLRGHMHRCSIMMRHGATWQDYSRFFLRWLAFTHHRTFESYRRATEVQKEVPLRTKEDFLALGRRYFVKWRTHLRERKQRVATNVDVLAALNRERLRSRTLLRWWSFHHTNATKQHHLEVREHEDTIRRLQAEVREAVKEAQSLRKERKVSVSASAGAPASGAHPHDVGRALRDPPQQPPLASTTADSSAHSSPYVSDTQMELVRSVESAIVALAELGHCSTTPMSLEACIECIRRRLEEDANELSKITAQRDELAAAVKAARHTFASMLPSMDSIHNSIIDPEVGASRDTSVSSLKLGGGGSRNDLSSMSTASVIRSSRHEDRSGNRALGAAAAIHSKPLFSASLPSRSASPYTSLPNSPHNMTEVDFQELPRLLIEDAKTVASTAVTLHKSDEQAKGEVADLQDAALRTISALGGSGIVNDDFIAPADETIEARAQRSHAIAKGLRNLCEDMIVVLVLTSLWSGKCASERVSEALERLWHRTQDLESTDTDYVKQLNAFEKVVHVAARMLRQPTPAPAEAALRIVTPRRAWAGLAKKRRTASAAEVEGPPTPDELDAALRCAEELSTKGDTKPAELLKLCEEALRKTAAQSTLQTSELEDLLQSSHNLLAATVGAEKDGVVPSSSDLSSSEQYQLSDSIVAAATPTVQETVAALKVATQKVACVLSSVGDSASKPLAVVTEGLLDQVMKAQKAHAELAQQLRTAVAQVEDVENQRRHDASNFDAVEQTLRKQLDALEAQCQQSEETRVQLEAQVREGDSQAQATEKAHQEQLAELVEAQRTAEHELQQQLRALERDLDQQTEERQRVEGALAALQKVSSDTAKCLQESQAALETVKTAHAQALKQCETAAAERKLHAEEMQKAKEAHDAAVEERQMLTASIETLRSELQSAEMQQASSSEKEQELQKRLGDLVKHLAQSDDAKRQLKDQLTAATTAREDDATERANLEEQLRAVEGECRVSSAVSVFLRDVLRDCLTRLHHLTYRVGDTTTLSPRASLTLQQAGDTQQPPLLTQDSDPSHYVEYVLRLDGNDAAGKRLVQEHLRENCAIAPSAVAATASTPTSTGAKTDPSTWEVVAELHDRLVLLYERMAQLDQVAADQLAMNAAFAHEQQQLCADALVTLQQLQPWSSAAASAAALAVTHSAGGLSCSASPVSPTSAKEAGPQSTFLVEPSVTGPALRTSSSEVAQALEALRKTADSVRSLVEPHSPRSTSQRAMPTAGQSESAEVATESLRILVADVQDMASCLESLSESVSHGILALGGAVTDDGEKSLEGGVAGAGSPHRGGGGDGDGDGGGTAPGKKGLRLYSRKLAARLETICEETGTSILEVERLLLGSAVKSTAGQGPVRPVRLSDAIPQIRAKIMELEEVNKASSRLLQDMSQAFDDDESLFAMTVSSSQSRSIKPKKKPLPAFQGTPEAGLRLLHQEAKGKKGQLAGSSPESAVQKGSRGSRIRDRLNDLQNLYHVCRNTLEVLGGQVMTEDGKPPTYGDTIGALLTTQVEDLKQALVESEKALEGSRSDVRNVAVGTRLHLLADVVNSLKLERDSLKEDISRRGRQSNMLLDNLNNEVKALKAEIASHQQETAQLTTVNDRVSEELAAQRRNAAELATGLTQLQHESNVLSTALARSLQGLSASSYSGKTPSAVEKSVQEALKTDQGDALNKSVEWALSAAEQHHQQLHATLRTSLHGLKMELQEVRALTSQSWALYGAPTAEAVAQFVTETSEVLTLENDMLRPRAVEREKLKREVASLKAALAESKTTCDAAVERVTHLDDEVTQLRRALRDAEMAQVLNSTDSGCGMEPTSRGLDRSMVEWERRMIAGATDLAMDAIDSMCGRSMTAVVGSVMEETLRIYKGVWECLRCVSRACAAAHGTDGRRLSAEVEECLHDLDALSASADYLWTRLPTLYRVPDL